MENNQEAKYIERIEIKGLWGRYDVDWTLNYDVNILVGENGTGKSTILEIIYKQTQVASFPAAASGKITESQSVDLNFNKFASSILRTNYGSEIVTEITNDNMLYKLAKTTREGIEPLISSINIIKTFDANPFNQSEYIEKNKSYVKTHLDQDLDSILPKYIVLQNKLLRRNGDKEKTLEKINYFFDTVNRLFSSTGKKIFEDPDITDANLMLKFIAENGEKLNVFQLSSGEKQLLIILLTVLCQDEKPSILLLDEPEISLDVSWQFELIEIIRNLNQNSQVIIVTHSPAIYGKGWRDKVTFIEDIIPQLKKATV
jgi:ABC-type lipoprotein export system ATPase subunit